MTTNKEQGSKDVRPSCNHEIKRNHATIDIKSLRTKPFLRQGARFSKVPVTVRAGNAVFCLLCWLSRSKFQ